MQRDRTLNVLPYTAALQQLASTFESGNDYIDSFLRHSMSLDSSFGKTYVWLSKDNDMIVGYYNIGTGCIEEEQGSHKYKLGGAVHINEFALDRRFQGQTEAYTEDGTKINLSDLLLYDCLQQIETIQQECVGFTFVTLCSTEEGYSLYKRNGFDELDDGLSFSIEQSELKCVRMYSPIAVDY